MVFISAECLWKQYQKSKHIQTNKYEAWSFGNTPQMADELLQLVIEQTKTGTSSLHLIYDLENEPLPNVGEYSVILDGRGCAQAIIQLKALDILPYDQISEIHGYLEGEGDRNLSYWRRVHRDYFTNTLAQVGKSFSEDMLVVYELFELVFTN